jgi:hypothetical protein
MTSATALTDTVQSVRNVSEKSLYAPLTKDTLAQLLALLDANLHPGTHRELCADMARRLSQIAHKRPAWGWRYVQSVASGTVQPSRRFAAAVDVLAVSFDGVPVVAANAAPITVYAEAGTIREGALVMGRSVMCANPGCSTQFVPNVPWRRYCPVCNPIKERESNK